MLSQLFAIYQFNFTLTYGQNRSINISADYPSSEPGQIFYRNGILYITDVGVPALFFYANNTITKMGASLSNPISIFVTDTATYFSDGGMLVKRPSTVIYTQADARGIYFFNDSFYISDNKGRIIMVNKDGKYIGSFGKNGSFSGEFSAPRDIQIFGDSLYIADSGNGRVESYTLNFTYQKSYGSGKEDVVLQLPIGIFVNKNYVYVADKIGNQIVAYTKDGYPVFIYNINDPRDVVVADGKIYISQGETGSIIYANFTEPDPALSTNMTLSALSQEYSRYLENSAVADLLGLYYNTTVVSEWRNANFAFENKNYGESFYKAMKLNATINISMLNSNLSSLLNSTLFKLAQNSSAKNEILVLLSRGNYSGAYAKLSAQPTSEVNQTNTSNNTDNEINTSTNVTPKQLDTTLLVQRLNSVKKMMLDYNLSFDVSQIEYQLMLAKTNQSAFDLAELMLKELENKLNLTVYKVRVAQEKLSKLRAELDNKKLFGDYSKASAFYENATIILYIDPEKAKLLAEEGLVEVENAKSSAYLTYGWIFAAGGIALLVIAAVLFLIKRMKSNHYRFKKER